VAPASVGAKRISTGPPYFLRKEVAEAHRTGLCAVQVAPMEETVDGQSAPDCYLPPPMEAP
jgi:hypothetical protein